MQSGILLIVLIEILTKLVGLSIYIVSHELIIYMVCLESLEYVIIQWLIYMRIYTRLNYICFTHNKYRLFEITIILISIEMSVLLKGELT